MQIQRRGLHDSLLKEIILLAGGDPELVAQYLNDS